MPKLFDRAVSRVIFPSDVGQDVTLTNVLSRGAKLLGEDVECIHVVEGGHVAEGKRLSALIAADGTTVVGSLLEARVSEEAQATTGLGKSSYGVISAAIARTDIPLKFKRMAAEALAARFDELSGSFNGPAFVRASIKGATAEEEGDEEETEESLDETALTRRHFAMIASGLAELDMPTNYKRALVGAIASAVGGSNQNFNHARFVKATGLAPGQVKEEFTFEGDEEDEEDDVDADDEEGDEEDGEDSEDDDMDNDDSASDDEDGDEEDESFELPTDFDEAAGEVLVCYHPEGVQLVNEDAEIVALMRCDTQDPVASVRAIEACVEHAALLGFELIEESDELIESLDEDSEDMLEVECDAVDDLRAYLTAFVESCTVAELEEHAQVIREIDEAINDGDYELAEQMAEPLLEYKRMSQSARRMRIRSLRLKVPGAVKAGKTTRSEHRRGLMKRRRKYRSSSGQRAKAKRYAKRYQRFRRRLRPVSSAKSESFLGHGPQHREGGSEGDAGLRTVTEARAKANDAVTATYNKWFDRKPVSIMDLGKIRQAIENLLASGKEINAEMEALVKKHVKESTVTDVDVLAARARLAERIGTEVPIIRVRDGVLVVETVDARDSEIVCEAGDHLGVLAGEVMTYLINRPRTDAKQLQDHFRMSASAAASILNIAAQALAQGEPGSAGYNGYVKQIGDVLAQGSAFESVGADRTFRRPELTEDASGATRLLVYLTGDEAAMARKQMRPRGEQGVRNWLEANVSTYLADPMRMRSGEMWPDDDYDSTTYKVTAAGRPYTVLAGQELVAVYRGHQPLGESIDEGDRVPRLGKHEGDLKTEKRPGVNNSTELRMIYTVRGKTFRTAWLSDGHANIPEWRDRLRLAAQRYFDTGSLPRSEQVFIEETARASELPPELQPHARYFPQGVGQVRNTKTIDGPKRGYYLRWTEFGTVYRSAGATRGSKGSYSGTFTVPEILTRIANIEKRNATEYAYPVDPANEGTDEARQDVSKLTGAKTWQVYGANDYVAYIGRQGIAGESSKEALMSKLRSMGLDPKDFKKVGGIARVESVDEGVPEAHQKRIALSTLKMHAVGARVMGGMNHAQAVRFLRNNGYTEDKLRGMLKSYGHEPADIDAMFSASESVDEVTIAKYEVQQKRKDTPREAHMQTPHLKDAKAKARELSMTDSGTAYVTDQTKMRDGRSKVVARYSWGREVDVNGKAVTESIECVFVMDESVGLPTNGEHEIRDPASYGKPKSYSGDPTPTVKVPAFKLAKATVFMPAEMFGHWNKHEVNDLVMWRAPYAQYGNALHMQFRMKGKRKTVSKAYGYKPRVVVFDGWNVDVTPESMLGDEEPSTVAGVTVRKGRRASFDPGWDAEMDKRFAASKKRPVVSIMEGLDVCESAEDVIAEVSRDGVVIGRVTRDGQVAYINEASGEFAGQNIHEIERPGKFTIKVWKMQRSQWGYSVGNPQGGSFSSSTSYKSADSLVKWLLGRIPMGAKAGDPVLVVQGQSSGDSVVVSRSYDATWGGSSVPATTRREQVQGSPESDTSAEGLIRVGDRVTIRTPQNQTRSGRAVMQGPAGWVLNMGGAHGTPGIASDANIVSIKRGGQWIYGSAQSESTLGEAFNAKLRKRLRSGDQDARYARMLHKGVRKVKRGVKKLVSEDDVDEATVPWIYVSWEDDPEESRGSRATMETHAVLWKKNATEADMAKARTHAKTLHKGRVHLGDARTKIADVKAAQAAGETIGEAARNGMPRGDGKDGLAFHARGMGRSNERLKHVKLTGSGAPVITDASNPQTLGKHGDEFRVTYKGRDLGTIAFKRSTWSSFDADGAPVSTHEGWSARNAVLQLLNSELGDAWGAAEEARDDFGQDVTGDKLHGYKAKHTGPKVRPTLKSEVPWFLVKEGNKLRAGQSTEAGAQQYMKPGRKMVKGKMRTWDYDGVPSQEFVAEDGTDQSALFGFDTVSEADEPADDFSGLKKLPGKRPMMTNAAVNRSAANEMLKAGMTPAQVAKEFGRVWKLTDGKLGQKYDSYYADGSKETRVTITRSAMLAAIKRHRNGEEPEADESEEIARKWGIQSPNSSGQGHYPDHAKNPYHETLVKAGFAYSHTTPVMYAGPALHMYKLPGDDDPRLHHTYKLPGADFNVSVYLTFKDRNWQWDGSKGGSGRRHHGTGVAELAKYLKGATRRHGPKTEDFIDLLNGTYLHERHGIVDEAARTRLLEEEADDLVEASVTHSGVTFGFNPNSAGKGVGSYWFQKPDGARNVVAVKLEWKKSASLRDRVREAFRYKLRNELNIPGSDADRIIKDVDAQLEAVEA